MDPKKSVNRQSNGIRKPAQRPYTSPQLRVHGTVERITKGGSSGSSEGSHKSNLTRRT
jgi:hypothetical protein